MVSHPENGSDSPIGSDRDWGRDKTSFLEASLWEDTLALSYRLSDSLVWVGSFGFNMVGGLGPLHIVGQVGLGPNGP